LTVDYAYVEAAQLTWLIVCISRYKGAWTVITFIKKEKEKRNLSPSFLFSPHAV